MTYEFKISTPHAMEKLGKKVASCTPKGTCIALTGPLGCGKSVFARGFIRSFGIKEHILSPTFTLLQQYGIGDFDIFHFDLYRLSSAEEFDLIGGSECLASDSICLIEWPEIIREALSLKTTAFVDISITPQQVRVVKIECQFEIK